MLKLLIFWIIVISTSARSQAFQLSEQTENPLDLANHLPFRIAVVSNLLALNRDWDVREMCDLEPREMRVLLNIGSYMPIKAADIAYQSRIDSYNVSRAVKALDKKQLIDFIPDSRSKNIKYLVLNDAGTALYKQLTEALNERSAELESALSKEELVKFFNMLERIEQKSEHILAQKAMEKSEQGLDVPADQKELIRWYKRGSK